MFERCRKCLAPVMQNYWSHIKISDASRICPSDDNSILWTWIEILPGLLEAKSIRRLGTVKSWVMTQGLVNLCRCPMSCFEHFEHHFQVYFLRVYHTIPPNRTNSRVMFKWNTYQACNGSPISSTMQLYKETSSVLFPHDITAINSIYSGTRKDNLLVVFSLLPCAVKLSQHTKLQLISKYVETLRVSDFRSVPRPEVLSCCFHSFLFRWVFCQVARGPIDCPPWHYGYTFRRKGEEWVTFEDVFRARTLLSKPVSKPFRAKRRERVGEARRNGSMDEPWWTIIHV